MTRCQTEAYKRYLFCSTLPYWRNPNLKPVGKGFGFLIFIEQIGELL